MLVLFYVEVKSFVQDWVDGFILFIWEGYCLVIVINFKLDEVNFGVVSIYFGDNVMYVVNCIFSFIGDVNYGLLDGV